jgi:hypothetical protein
VFGNERNERTCPLTRRRCHTKSTRRANLHCYPPYAINLIASRETFPLLTALQMPVRKYDKSLKRRHLVSTTLFAIPFLICFAYAWTTSHFWPGAIGCGVTALVGLIVQELRFRRYHCPDCGALLPYRPAAPGARIEYVCSRCDVTWDSGFVEPEKDSS